MPRVYEDDARVLDKLHGYPSTHGISSAAPATLYIIKDGKPPKPFGDE